MILHLPVLTCSFPNSSVSPSTLHFFLHLNTQHIPYSPLPDLFPVLRFKNRLKPTSSGIDFFPHQVFIDSLPGAKWCFGPQYSKASPYEAVNPAVQCAFHLWRQAVLGQLCCTQ